jgi:hypothetical protein
MASPTTDEQYYQVARPYSLSERVVIMARDRIYSDFVRLCKPQPESTILDIGVSDVVTDAANLLERLYPYPAMITAAGLGDGVAFRHEYPAVTYKQITAGERLPFEDGAFDIACANAVLEHVGSVAEQHRFVAEMARVARTVYITVPHRYFPVEHHTGFPLVHYSDYLFSLACRLFNKDEWADEKNLIFMTPSTLQPLVPQNRSATIGYTGIPCGPFSSNAFMLLSAI